MIILLLAKERVNSGGVSHTASRWCRTSRGQNCFWTWSSEMPLRWVAIRWVARNHTVSGNDRSAKISA